MKKLLLTTAVAIAFASTAAFAHHPAEFIVDPDIYLMIDENVSDVHADMTFEDDMGGDTTVGGNAAAIDTAGVGAEMSGDVEDVGAAEEQREENNAMADPVPSGPGAQR